jgi:A/G-specific adenine glycosylase
MLQQTQVSRVVPKYEAWLKAFPGVDDLAAAPLGAVLSLWSGLGYNRRAKWLKESASAIVDRHDGTVPRSIDQLDALPGVGPYTARAVAAFAFGSREPFIETNIRRVFIHFFFQGREGGDKIRDAEILPLVDRSLEGQEPRHWFYALMDYGSALPSVVRNPNRLSSVYVKQAPLKGSKREARGIVLKSIARGVTDIARMALESGTELKRLEEAGRALLNEGMVAERPEGYGPVG